jgi:uncharacterized membrane protein
VERHPGRGWAVVAAAIMLAIVTSFFVYFERANASFAAAAITVDAVPVELARWAAWHHARTALALVAFAASLLAVRASR